MEIKEVLNYYVNVDTNILEVNFRTIEDGDDVSRYDHIDYSLVEDYGYILETESLDFFGLEDEDDDFDKNDIELDEDSLLSFLNEYYEINPNSIPKPTFH